MNPIKWIVRQIASLFSFFIDDIKTDFNTIQRTRNRLKTGDPIFGDNFKRQFKREFNVGSILKSYWPFILFCILCFTVGYMLAGMKCNVECENAMFEVLEDAKIGGHYNPVIIDNYNLSAAIENNKIGAIK